MTTSLEMEVIERIKRLVAEHFGITVDKMLSSRRNAHLVWPRQIAMALCRRQGITFQHVGRQFGRDHGTVMHACEIVNARTSWNKTDMKHVLAIQSEILRTC